MLYVNPKVARPGPSRPHARPRLMTGERLFVPASELPPVAADGTRNLMTEADWRDLTKSVGTADALPGSTWNLV